jgi:DNA-binding CsgD family transcriptional regulator
MIHRPSNGAVAEPNELDCGKNSASDLLPASADSARISAAEKRVLTLVTCAKTNKEIAQVLGISPATVKRHLERILKKLQLRNRVEAAIYGLMMTGCVRHSEPACPLASWRKERAIANESAMRDLPDSTPFRRE